MFRKRRRKGNGGKGVQPPSDPSAPVPPGSTVPPPAPVAAERRAHVPQMSDAFKSIVERATERAKSDLASKGKLGQMAFFVHEDGTMKVVSLTFRDEIQKEVLIKRVREKVAEEKAGAVLILTAAEPERQGTAVLSGAMPGQIVSARLEYSYDKKAKTVTSWKVSWLDRPVHAAYLNGLFGKTG